MNNLENPEAKIVDTGERLYVRPIAVTFDRTKCKLFPVESQEMSFYTNEYMPLMPFSYFSDDKWLKVKAYLIKNYNNIKTTIQMMIHRRKIKCVWFYYRQFSVVFCADVCPVELGIDRTFWLESDEVDGEYMIPKPEVIKYWLDKWIHKRSTDPRYKEFRASYIRDIQKYYDWLEKNKDYEIEYLISLDT